MIMNRTLWKKFIKGIQEDKEKGIEENTKYLWYSNN